MLKKFLFILLNDRGDKLVYELQVVVNHQDAVGLIKSLSKWAHEGFKVVLKSIALKNLYYVFALFDAPKIIC